jgi:hypothetical protein
MAAKPQLVDNAQLQFSASQLREMLKQAEETEAKLAAEKGPEIRKELEDYLLKKYGLSLEAIGLVEKTERKAPEPRTYLNPNTKETYVYKGWGKVADDILIKKGFGVKDDATGKWSLNPNYLVKTENA